MADAMAAGLNSRLTSTANACGICAGELKDYSHLGENAVSKQACFVLQVHGLWTHDCRSLLATFP